MDFIDDESEKEFVTISKEELNLRKYCNYFIVP